MTEPALRKTTGVLFTVGSLLMLTCFILLGVVLDYPDILREETGVVLTRIHQAGVTPRFLYYGLALSAALVIFEAVLFQCVFENESRDVFLELGKTAGIIAGLAFIFGFMRWVFLVPMLAGSYVESGASSTSETAAALFRAFDVYLGFSVGEHVGFLFLSLMLVFFGLGLARLGKPWSRLGWCGAAIGLGVLYGDGEAFDLPFSFEINRVASKLSLVWMIVVGVYLVFSRKSPDRP